MSYTHEGTFIEVIHMKLTFYKYAGTPNRIDKSDYITEVGSVDNVNLKADTDLMRPIFILRTNPTVYNANYFYCDTTQRYYYINNITAMDGGRISIDGEIDVLYTFKEEILNSPAWVKKSGIPNDNDIPDVKMMHQAYPFRQDYYIDGIDFPNQPIGNYSEGKYCFVTLI